MEDKGNIIIFGASTRGVHVYKKMKNNYHIKYFCDNDIHKFGKELCGIKVISPKELSDLNYKIIIASMYYKEISVQLNNMGIYDFEVYPSSMECVINQLSERGVDFEKIDALEVFGGTGSSVEVYYGNLVRTLEVWEINKDFEIDLRNNLPKANIKIVDSFKEIKITKNKYDMIVMDNPMQNFENHCENFDMFIESFRVLKDEAIIILDLIPNIDDISSEFNYLKSDDHILCRKLFYRTLSPLNIPISEMVKSYKDIVESNNYELEWYFTEERSENFIYYLVLKIKKNINF